MDDGVVRLPAASWRFIVVEAAGSGTVQSTLSAPARAEFREGAVSRIGAPVSGRVTGVHVRTGDRVKAGERLVTLDAPDAAAARTEMETVTAALREARLTLERERRMLDRGIGIERERLAAETRVAELESALARTQTGVAFVGDGTGGAVALRAPISGTVLAMTATVGMAVAQGADPLIEVGDPSALWIVADVFERDVPLVREGAAVRIDLPSVPGPVEGRVSSIGTVVSTGLRTAPVRIALSTLARPLRPGMYGRAEITIDAEGDFSLPTEAVLVKGRDTIVYVEQSPGTFVRRQVLVAQPSNGRVRVVSGLEPGERVVVRGALLVDGTADQLL